MSTANAESLLREFAEGLKGQLDAWLVDAALEYVDHGESLLAFETLCDHIADYDVYLTSTEVDQVRNLVRAFKQDGSSRRYQYLTSRME